MNLVNLQRLNHANSLSSLTPDLEKIQRKINQLELTVHAARPKAIASETDNANLITNLKEQLTKIN